MDFNPKVFKAYDIRGVYGEDLDEKFAYRLGLVFAELRRKELGRQNIRLAVSRDMRISSPELEKNLVRGLVDAGADVIDIGLASTPTFYFAVANYGYDGGIQVSASHNPAEYNGFKLVREKALPIGEGTGMEEIKNMMLRGNLEKAKVPGNVVLKNDVLDEQIKHDLNFADVSRIKPFKIVIDPANAMGSLYFDALAKYLPGKIIRMNWELDGRFPNHEADPFKEENLVALAKKVVVEKADIGISTDGDADRIFFVAEDGQMIEAGITRAIMCKIFLMEKPGSKIAYDIRPGKITPDVILENGGIPIVTRVGHSLIKAQAIAEKAYFAGESSGHFFLNMKEGCYEVPIIVTLKMLSELSRANVKFSEYLKPYQKYFHSGEINSKVENTKMKIDEIKKHYSDAKLNELDGITVEYPNFWFNVRPSNTEPLLRLNLEAVSKKVMEEKRDEVLGVIRK